MTIEIGRLVLKTAGRDAGKKGLVIDVLDDIFVMIDGQVRRRKCNLIHIEPLNQVLKIERNAAHDQVYSVLKEIGIDSATTKPKQKSEKPKKKRKTSEQLREHREEKRKLRDVFKPKKEDVKQETILEKTASELSAGRELLKPEEHHLTATEEKKKEVVPKKKEAAESKGKPSKPKKEAVKKTAKKKAE